MDEIRAGNGDGHIVYGVEDGTAGIVYVGVAHGTLAGVEALRAGGAEPFEIDCFASLDEAQEAATFWRCNFRFLGWLSPEAPPREALSC